MVRIGEIWGLTASLLIVQAATRELGSIAVAFKLKRRLGNCLANSLKQCVSRLCERCKES